MKRLRVAVVGVGHLGKEHARILAGFPEVELVGVADVNAEQAQAVARRVGTRAFVDYWPLLNLVDAACIAVPTSQHEAVACDFLRRGIPLLVEKPLAPDLAAADRLVVLARESSAPLQVGHIERYNPAFEALRQRAIRPLLVRAHRVGPFTGRSGDVGVVLDLMIHDLDLLRVVVGAPVRQIQATGVSVFGAHEDVACARIEFANGCVAELLASRASAAPSRVMQVWAAEGFAELDFAQRRLTMVQPSEEVRRHGLDAARLDPASRARLREELFGRHLETQVIDGRAQDQLSAELRDFVQCVRTGVAPRVGASDGRAAIALAEQVLTEVRAHSWGETRATCGPTDLPPPLGRLFERDADADVA